VVVAGRPGMGKSALAQTMAMSMARESYPVLLHSMEMDDREVVQRFFAQTARVDLNRIRGGTPGDYDWQQLGDACTKLGPLPIWIDERPGLTLEQLTASIRRVVTEYGVRVAFIDYAQLVVAKDARMPHHLHVAQVFRALKELARTLKITVVALSQLNREVEKRSDKRPILSDLAESGGVEQAADLVLFVYRPEVYETEGESTRPGEADLIVAKQRSGRTGVVQTIYLGPLCLFVEPAREPEPAMQDEFSR
jgi:replicative DNA helicase